jgi:hypothetical protein
VLLVERFEVTKNGEFLEIRSSKAFRLCFMLHYLTSTKLHFEALSYTEYFDIHEWQGRDVNFNRVSRASLVNTLKLKHKNFCLIIVVKRYSIHPSTTEQTR